MPDPLHVVLTAQQLETRHQPGFLSGHSAGLQRLVAMDRSGGSVHIGYCVLTLQPGGHVDRCVNAYEKGFYVLAGTLDVERDGQQFCLATDGYILIPAGVPHAVRNFHDVAVQWVEVSVPQPKPVGGWRDSFFVDPLPWQSAKLMPLDPGDPRSRMVGKNNRKMPPGAFMHADLQGFSIKRFIDREFGSAHFTLFSVEFADGGLCNHHDHPFEEAYLILSGSVDVEFDGINYALERGDFAWTGVGSRHAFFPVSGRPVCWLEIQAPQPPSQFGMRWHGRWERFAREVGK
jgi:mannose-6-phosphate isomerase-like protein (cupin superfamily)